MKELKRYMCEVCGTIYESYADAARCEEEHKIALKSFQDVFLEQFPEAMRAISEVERPAVCVKSVFGRDAATECVDSPTPCVDCWNRPAPEEYQA